MIKALRTAHMEIRKLINGMPTQQEHMDKEGTDGRNELAKHSEMCSETGWSTDQETPWKGQMGQQFGKRMIKLYPHFQTSKKTISK